MKLLIAILVVLLLALQYRLWIGEGSFSEVAKLRQSVAEQQRENDRLEARNQALEAEVQDLTRGLSAIEERARSELGMIKKGETFFQVIEPPSIVPDPAPVEADAAAGNP
ncbi:MAG: cell division protein FtsB [Thiotrichales bacterium]